MRRIGMIVGAVVVIGFAAYLIAIAWAWSLR